MFAHKTTGIATSVAGFAALLPRNDIDGDRKIRQTTVPWMIRLFRSFYARLPPSENGSRRLSSSALELEAMKNLIRIMISSLS